MENEILALTISTNAGCKWRLLITKNHDQWKVEEDTKYSLFNSDHWESGKTPGEALDAFLRVSDQLLENL